MKEMKAALVALSLTAASMLVSGCSSSATTLEKPIEDSVYLAEEALIQRIGQARKLRLRCRTLSQGLPKGMWTKRHAAEQEMTEEIYAAKLQEYGATLNERIDEFKKLNELLYNMWRSDSDSTKPPQRKPPPANAPGN